LQRAQRAALRRRERRQREMTRDRVVEEGERSRCAPRRVDPRVERAA
jgi:hypothetical protein